MHHIAPARAVAAALVVAGIVLGAAAPASAEPTDHLPTHTGTLTVSLPESPQAQEVLTAELGGDLSPEPTYTEYTWIVDGEPLADVWEETLDLEWHGIAAGSEVSVIAESAAFEYEPGAASSQTVTVIPGPTLDLEIVNVPSGLGIDLVGTYFLDTGPVSIELHDQPEGAAASSPDPVLDPEPTVLGTVEPDSDGAFVFAAPLADASNFVLYVRDAEGAVLAFQSMMFMGADDPVPEPTPDAPADERLAVSGKDGSLLVVASGGVLMLGAGALMLTRRSSLRRQAQPADAAATSRRDMGVAD
ncbi:hypothetical protein BKA24_000822 [Microbacterium marinum]|uniref:LPXTG-motif cell wall anchor domain-containing protein n=1 Tax=Microbacterium marinum TaxID=421115 RepID=A0A7W7FIH9_9MICO|nr:hypothetical protein [Microbacterium marinum]MBB4666113.1 hypothetical protein [Microbacterium marinum]